MGNIKVTEQEIELIKRALSFYYDHARECQEDEGELGVALWGDEIDELEALNYNLSFIQGTD